MNEVPQNHLDDTEKESEVKSGFFNKTEFLLTATQEQLVHDAPVVFNLVQHHFLYVPKVKDVVLDFLHDLTHGFREFVNGALKNIFLSPFWQRRPNNGKFGFKGIFHRLPGKGPHFRFQFLGNALRVQAAKNLLDINKVFQDHIRG